MNTFKNKKYIKIKKNNSLSNILTSVIINVDNIDKEHDYLKESFEKIKTKDNSLEFIFIKSESIKIEEWDKYIYSLKLTTKFPIRSVDAGINEFFSNAIHESNGKTLVFLNSKKLKSFIYLVDFIKITKDNTYSNKLIIPVFEEGKTKTKIDLSEPLFCLSKDKACQLSLLASTLKINFINAIKDFGSKIELEIDNYYFQNSNPFQFTKSQKDFTKIYKWLIIFYKWYILIPLKELSNQKLREINSASENSIFRLIFLGIALILFFLMPYMGYQSGISGDEYVNYKHAGYVMDYFKTSGADSTALNTPKTKLQYYGQSFDNITAIINEIFNVEKVYEVRHVLNSFSGWFAILFTGLLGGLIGGWRVGVLTLLFMFLSPRFIGHCWNNPKDIPFAMAYIYTIYYIVLFLKQLPRIKVSTIVFLTFGIALAISVRIGGLLLIAYLFMFTGLYYLFNTRISQIFNKINLIQLGKTFLLISISSVAGYFIGLMLWPYALQNPIENPLNALKEMTNFTASIRQVFEGDIIWSNKVPWHYSIKYMLISIPAAILTGFIISLFTSIKNRKKINLFFLFILLFSFVFPVIYIIYKDSNLYGGWRHLLFAYPTLVIISAIGYESILKVFKNKYPKIIFLTLLLCLFFHPIKHIIVNHPYQYIYYNELYGSKKAFGKYEMDYYYHSTKEASEWLIDNIINKHNGEKLIIGCNGVIDYFFRHHKEVVTPKYIRYYDRGNDDWDYLIVCNSYLNPFQLQKNIWPPKNTVHTIKVNNQPVCAIVKREDKNDYLGFKAMMAGKRVDAINYLEKAVKFDKNNEVALLNLAWNYNEIRSYDKALKNIRQCLNIYPNYEKALDLAGRVYLQKNEIATATSIFEKAIKINYKFSSAYYYLAYIQFYKLKNNELALRYVNDAIGLGYKNNQARTLKNNIQVAMKKQNTNKSPNRKKQSIRF